MAKGTSETDVRLFCEAYGPVLVSEGDMDHFTDWHGVVLDTSLAGIVWLWILYRIEWCSVGCFTDWHGVVLDASLTGILWCWILH